LDPLISEQQLFTTQSQLVGAQQDAEVAEIQCRRGGWPADRAGDEIAGAALCFDPQ
jgi:hypothetical protein